MSEQEKRKGTTYWLATIDHRPAALVASMLDNGDFINDSPHREPRTSTIFVPINERGVERTRE